MTRMKNKLGSPINEKLIDLLPEDAILDVSIYEYKMGIFPPNISVKYVAIASGIRYQGEKGIRISKLSDSQQFKLLEAALVTLQE